MRRPPTPALLVIVREWAAHPVAHPQSDNGSWTQPTEPATHGEDRTRDSPPWCNPWTWSGLGDAVLRQAYIDGLQRALGTRVGFRPAKEGGGTLTIHYNSDEELNALYTKLGGEDLW